METLLFKKVKNAIDHWYLLLFVGLLLMSMGIWCLATPSEAYLTLAFFFSMSFIFSGVSEILFAISNRKNSDNWGWILVLGILGLAAGTLLIGNPLISISILPVYVGFVILFRSMMAIGSAMDLKNYGASGWENLLVLGILGFLFSFILLWNPFFAGLSLVYWTSFAFIAIGIFYIIYSFKLKRIHDIV